MAWLVARRARGHTNRPSTRRRQLGFLRLSMFMARWGSRPFTVRDLFAAGEQGVHFEANDPTKLGIVRRNLLTSSEQISTWSRNSTPTITANGAAVDGITSEQMDTTANNMGVFKTGLTAVAGVPCSMQARIKYVSGAAPGVRMRFEGAAFPALSGIVINPQDGSYVISSGLAPTTISVTPTADGGWLMAITSVPGATGTVTPVLYSTTATPQSVLITALQFEVGPITPYQKVTDWNTEYVAAIGAAGIFMWQDAAATTAVYAVEQFVGRWVDRSGRANHATQTTAGSRPRLSARYNRLIANNYSPSAVSSVTKSGDAAGVLGVVSDTAAIAAAGLAGSCPSGNVYELDNSAGATDALATVANDGTMPITANLVLYCQARVVSGAQGGTMRLSNATGTAAFNNAAYASVTTTTASTAATNSLQIVAKAGSKVRFILFDLRTADDAARNIPAVQRLNTTSDYDTDGYPHYLQLDGNDDGLATGNIDCTPFDKVYVWASVTKLSDANPGMIAELSATATTNAGSFNVAAASASGLANYSARSGGTVSVFQNTAQNYAAPISNVLAVLADISAPSLAVRITNVSASTAGSQGSGTFGNYAFFIGRRAGASLPDNGRIYAVGFRASATPSSEAFVTKMNAYAARLQALTT